MSNPETPHPNPAEAFTQFWSDMFSRMGMTGAGVSAGPMSPEGAKQMQRIFLDTMARYFDEFMRSDQFLSMMKETMDRSLAFKQQVDQFLTQLYRGAQMPAKTDVDDISGLLRSIEKNVLDRLSRLEEKVAAVEDSRPTGSGAGASRAPQPSRREAMKGDRSIRKPR
ncbi:MAG: hypothetical protein DCC65_17900 [Planctomycetota bacterium]|nr:MAG: hypothetical protein DCC65_17900 [Planctomycetota bacterium]